MLWGWVRKECDISGLPYIQQRTSQQLQWQYRPSGQLVFDFVVPVFWFLVALELSAGNSSGNLLRSCSRVALFMVPFPPEAHSVHVEVHNGSGVESEHLAENQSADDRDAERASEFRTDAAP